MSEADFNAKYGLDGNDSVVKNFHSNRRMFAIKDNQLYLAPAGVSYSHMRWFEMEGWVTATNDSCINSIVRGFVDDNGVYFYTGYDFDVDIDAKHKMLAKLDELVEVLTVDATRHLYGGMVKQEKAGKWPPKNDYGRICDIII